jgi:hypothetical protein
MGLKNYRTLLIVTTILLAALLLGSTAALILVSRTSIPTGGTPPVSPEPTPTPSPAPSPAVSMTIIVNSQCTKCFNVSSYQPALEQIGVTFSSVKTLEYTDAAAATLMARYNISRVPALLLSKELAGYTDIAQNWDRIGRVDPDGSYVLQGSNPPYYDIPTKQVRGGVTLIALSDRDCAACYSVTLHQQALAQFRMSFDETLDVDIGSPEGKRLVGQYNITAVPTILLRGDYALYPLFTQAWESVGTIEPDGAAVFRNLNVLGLPFLDLTTRTVVKRTTAAPATT